MLWMLSLIHIFSQAVNENEAREEAQACVYVLNGRQLDYPIYFDTEASGAEMCIRDSCRAVTAQGMRRGVRLCCPMYTGSV